MVKQDKVKLHEVCSECFKPHKDLENVSAILQTGMCVDCVRLDHVRGEA